MSELSKNELNEVFCDVRKAYRLLYMFQDRVMGTVRFISEQLGFGYSGGYCWFGNGAHRNGWGKLNNWAWDWLTMYHYEFHLGTFVIDGQTLRISVFLQSDTGFYDTPGAEHTAPRTFAPVEESATRLRLLVGRNAWHPDFAERFAKTFSKENNDYEVMRANDGDGVVVTKAFELSDFFNESSAKISLTEFVTHCQEQGISEIRTIQQVADSTK